VEIKNLDYLGLVVGRIYEI